MIDRLSADELYKLTKRVRYKAQMSVLRSQGIDFRIDGDGAPVVLRSAVEAILGGKPESEKHIEPDWSSLDAAS